MTKFRCVTPTPESSKTLRSRPKCLGPMGGSTVTIGAYLPHTAAKMARIGNLTPLLLSSGDELLIAQSAHKLKHKLVRDGQICKPGYPVRSSRPFGGVLES